MRAFIFAASLAFTLAGSPALCSESDACLDAVFAAMHPKSVITARFEVQKNLAGIDRTLTSRGYVTILPEGGLIWQTDFPFMQTVVFGRLKTARRDDDGPWQVQPAPAGVRILQEWTAAAATQRSRFQERFFLSCSRNNQQATLIASPKHGSVQSFLSEMSLTTDTVLRRALITSPDGSISRIHFSEHQWLDVPSAHDQALFEQVQ